MRHARARGVVTAFARLTLVAVFALATMTCTRDAQTQAASSPTSPTPGQTAPACSVQPGGSPGPVVDLNGPYYHQVVVARTADGTTLTDVHQVIDHASVPDGARLPDGAIGKRIVCDPSMVAGTDVFVFKTGS
jgi:hypothetical protein